MASFNIDSVTIKGFKGFTTSQRIDVGCRNLFVFGENGRGKSSVLESIRWCIWGGEQETLLRNTFYPDDCEVELGLRGPDGVWRLRRRMRLVGGRSDVQLFNPSGQRVPYEQMFPHLPRITGEGTYVILAEQQARGRAFVDITRFDSVLYAYIGLLEDKAFLERLGTLQEEFEKVKNELETKATELRKGQQEALSIVEEDLSRLLTRPPWDTETTPTFDETVEKIRVFGIAAGVSEPLPLNSPHVALGHIENSLTSDKSKESEDPAVKTTEETLHALSLLLVERTTKEVTLSALDTQLTQRTKELDALLGEETLDDIRQSVTRIYEGARTKVLETEIVQSSRDLIERTGQQGCPVCSSHTNGLLVMLREKSETISTQEREILEEQRAMKARSEKAIETSQKLEDIQASTEEVRGEQRKLDLELQTLLEVDEGEELTDKAIRDRRTELQAHMDGLRQAQDHREQWYEDYLRTGRKLREELSYHELRDRQANIQRRLEERFAGFNRSFETFLGSIESVEEIKVALDSAIRLALRSRMSALQDLMTEVYQHLTSQRSFDLVRLELAEDLRLQVKVASSRRDRRLYDYEDVLNGQALSALRLVPYFVFARFREEETIPLELLMLDDPSQRFDTGHIDLLFEELSNVASRAQLIIGTHEEDRFVPLLDRYFPHDKRKIVRVTGFDVDAGPTLEIS